MIVHTIPIGKSLVTISTSVHKIVGEVDTLNVLDQVGLVSAGLLAYCTFKHIDLLRINP